MSTHGRSSSEAYDGESRPSQHTKVNNGGWWAALAATLVVGVVGGLVIGIQIGKNDSSTTAATGGQFGNGVMGSDGGMRGGGTMGTVTAVTSDSIVVEDTRQNTTVTYAITSDTTVTDDGTTASVSDIAVGDTVLIRATSTSSSSSSDGSATTKTASSIVLNPSMQSGPGNQSSSSSSTN